MLAYYAPGPLELLIILFIGLLIFGVPVAIVIWLVMLNRKQRSGNTSPTYSELMTENHRLRDEIAALKNKQD